MTFVSYAQHGEDVILWRALGDRVHVSYVDVGAYDPTEESVTRALYERGWRGVNLEPEPGRIAAFERDRPEDVNLAVAAGDLDGSTTLLVYGTPGWSTIRPPDGGLPGGAESHEVEVPLRSLGTLLPELGLTHVDVLKIDVEGAEPAVVRGLLRGAVRPTVCVVEGVAPGHGRAAGEEAVDLLTAAGYQHCMFDGLNHYLTTDPALVPALSVPASPVDDYIRYPVARLIDEREHLVASIAALAADATRRAATPSPAESDPLVGDAAAPPLDVDDDTSTQLGPAEPDPSRAEPCPAELGGPARCDSFGAEPDGAATDTAAVDSHGAPDGGDTLVDVSRPEPIVDRALRLTRRREAFALLLTAAGPGSALPPPGAAAGGAARSLATLDFTALEASAPDEAVRWLYIDILGREPEPEGLAVHAGNVRAGARLLDVARSLAASEEALAAASLRRSQTKELLQLWALHEALLRLGVQPDGGAHAVSSDVVGHVLFVAAIFEVALCRPPTQPELAAEVAKLVAGTGRGPLMRAFARRPEPRQRMLGRRSTSPVGMLRRLRSRMCYYSDFRAMVLAAETRRITELMDTYRSVRATAERGR